MASAGVFCKMPSKIRLNTIWIAGGIKENQKRSKTIFRRDIPTSNKRLHTRSNKRSYGRVGVVVVVVLVVVVVEVLVVVVVVDVVVVVVVVAEEEEEVLVVVVVVVAASI